MQHITERKRQQRQRGANYTPEEKSTLFSIIYNYKDIIECKRIDGPTNMEKDSAWKKIHEMFNEQNQTGQYRTVESLQKLYENQKRSIKIRQDNQNREESAYKLKVPTHHDLLLSIISSQRSVRGLNNKYGHVSSSEVSEEDISIRQPEDCYANVKIKNEVESESVDWGYCESILVNRETNSKVEVMVNNSDNNSEPAEIESSSASTSVGIDKRKRNLPVDRELCKTWKTRRRAQTQNMRKLAEKLAERKLEIATLEKDKLIRREQWAAEEFALVKRSLELDIQIKAEYLEKLTNKP